MGWSATMESMPMALQSSTWLAGASRTGNPGGKAGRAVEAHQVDE